MSVFEKRVLRKVDRPKSEQVAGDWRKLHNKSFMIYAPKM